MIVGLLRSPKNNTTAHGSSNKAQVHPSIPCMSKTTKRADSDVTSPEDEEEDYNEDHDDMLEYDVVNLVDILNQKKQQHIPIVSFSTVEYVNTILRLANVLYQRLVYRLVYHQPIQVYQHKVLKNMNHNILPL